MISITISAHTVVNFTVVTIYIFIVELLVTTTEGCTVVEAEMNVT